jgi:putative tryptophan/tyrosine transport system substrate-binding protein
MRRREFITLLGGATAAWPLAARAQPSMPVIGFLSAYPRPPDSFSQHILAAFHRGLKELGYVEGQNVAIEYRWGADEYDRLPGFAADLVRRGVSVIVASTSPAVPVAKAASSTTPIVFSMGGDPVALGYVASLSQPGGNLTGVTTLNVELGPKRLELMHELVPTTTVLGLLINPTFFASSETLSRDVQAAARSIGLEIIVLGASTERDIDAVFANLSQQRVGALVVGADAFFNSRSEQLAALALRYAVPSIYQYRPFAAAGGLMSYGGNIAESYRQVGVYVGRILKGEKPADLPVQQFTKVELILNLKTARALGLTVPLTLLGRADEVIE